MRKISFAFLLAIILSAGVNSYASNSEHETGPSIQFVTSSALLPVEGALTEPVSYQGFVCVVRTQGGRLNIRSTPSTSGRIVGKLSNGTVVREVGVSGGWSKIADATSTGRTGRVLGWVLSAYIICGE